MATPQKVTWAEVLTAVGDKEPALLLGNGFSIALDPVFAYKDLFEEAKKEGLSTKAKETFDLLTTTNFEQVLHALDQAYKVAVVYGCKLPCTATSAIISDFTTTKTALIATISKVHKKFENAYSLDDTKKENCVSFLKSFKFIYTLNYDFLLYWVWVFGVNLRPSPFRGGDGFFPDSWEFMDLDSENGGIRFLHGALHLYVKNGTVHKQVYKSKALLEQVSEGINLIEEGKDSAEYPLFIAEGQHKEKLNGINQNPYLHRCFSEFRGIGPYLVVYGCQLADSDQHIVDAIANNRKLKHLFIANHGNSLEPQISHAMNRIQEIRRKSGITDLETLAWFDSKNVNPWT